MSSFANDDALIREFVTESQEHLSDIEPDLLELEKQGASIDQDRVNRILIY
jgi:two-component system chemotaxis sensor kinase CheA